MLVGRFALISCLAVMLRLLAASIIQEAEKNHETKQ
jgi:hypothetical protein